MPTSAGLTSPSTEDRVRRRREQYKAYQRRRRAKERLRLEQLQREVEALTEETQTLQLQSFHLFSSRGTNAGAPARLVAEFYNVYAHGHSTTNSTSQAQFLRSMMAVDVEGPDYRGVESLVHQWWLYGTLFVTSSYVPLHTTVYTIGTRTLVAVDVEMTVRPNRDGVRCLFPGFGECENILQRVLYEPIVTLGSVRFLFDAAGKVTWFGADMDFMTALLAIVGSIERLSHWLNHSQLSLSTGHIAEDCDVTSVCSRPAVSERHSVAYLLS